jgi:hypothetical protein
MNYRLATDHLHRAKVLHDQLEDHGVDIPKQVADAWALFEQVNVPVAPAPDAAAHAMALGKPAAEVQKILLAQLLAEPLRQAAAQAQSIAAKAYLKAVREHAEELHEQLRLEFDEVSDAVHRGQALGNVSVDRLVRDRRVEDAQILAELPTNRAKLNALYALRNLIWAVKETSIDGVDVSTTRQPIRAISNELPQYWWPTPSEWAAAAGPFIRQAEQKAEQQQAKRRSEFARMGLA